jgi:hypothetical protein
MNVNEVETNVIEPKTAPEGVSDEVVAANRAETPVAETGKSRWEARHDLARFRAETERVKVLVEFLGHPIHAHGGADPDPDIITAYNLAVEAALQGIRRAAASEY